MIRLYVISHECAETANLSKAERQELMLECDACLKIPETTTARVFDEDEKRFVGEFSRPTTVVAISVGGTIDTEIGCIRVTGFELGGKVILGEIVGGVQS